MWSSTPSPTRLRRPVRPPKSKKTWAACLPANCGRWGSATPIWTSMATSMRRSRPIPTSGFPSFASARIWTPRPTAPARTSNRRSSGIIAAATSYCRAIRRRSSGSRNIQRSQPDRQRHRHLGRHHAARRRQQGRPCRNHGCGAFPGQQSADQARRDQDPVHAGRGNRPRRRQGRFEETRRRFCLYHRR